MEYDGYDEVVRAWIQGVYDSRGNDAKRTLKLCYDIEQYAMKKNDPIETEQFEVEYIDLVPISAIISEDELRKMCK